MGCHLNKKQKYLLGLGIVSIILALIIVFSIPAIVNLVLEQNIVLEEGSAPWERFVDFPLPIDFKVYMFQVENPDEVLNKGKANLTEIGPFVFKTKRTKKNITWLEDDEFVTYNQYTRYTFDREATPANLNLSTRVISINALVMGLYQLLESADAFIPFEVEEILKYIFDNTGVFYEYEVGKVLFDGVEFCAPQNESLEAKFVCMLVTFLNLKMVEYEVCNNEVTMKYSFFGYKNNKHDGLYKVNTGQKDISKIGEVVAWENMEYTNFWRGERSECDRVHGLESTVYPPHTEKDSSFSIYVTDICRAADVDYDKPSKYRDIDTYHFRMDEDVFRADLPEESCYCVNKTLGLNGERTCFLDGVLDLHACIGIPALASRPHFLLSNPKYLEDVIGLKPNESIHETEMDIEPFSGQPLAGYKRLQINMIVRPTDYSETTKNLSSLLLPILWVDESVEMDDEYYDMVKFALDLLYGVTITQWVLFAIFMVITVVSGYYIYKISKKK